MANHMETNIQVKNGDIKVIEKLKEIFTPKEGEYQVDASDLVDKIYDKSPEEYDRGWMIDEVGAKWMYSEFDLDDDLEYMELRLTSAWSVPQQFLEKLAKVLSDIKEDCYILGTYEDEGLDPIGAFLYSKDWDDIEDYDMDIDYDKVWDDDEYRDDIYEKLNDLKNEMEGYYHEHLEDKKNNPEDYE
jgi:hypothetical protein